MRLAAVLLAYLSLFGSLHAQEEAGGAVAEPVRKLAPDVQAAIEALELPGVRINLGERCVDVASEVCLDDGMLELVACTRDSKEHESIVAIDAKAMHIHTALLLLGAKSGNPAMRKDVGDGEHLWIDIPPAGGEVEVSLAFVNEDGKNVERPISDFIARADPAGLDAEADAKDRKNSFPTHTFLFAGSQIVAGGERKRTYLADRDGNVVSIATFGDEMLCLAGVHSPAKGDLRWQVDPEFLPAVGSKVTLRLRPKIKSQAPRKEQSKDSDSDAKAKGTNP